MELELDFVRALTKLMSEHNLKELNLEDDQQRIRLVRGNDARDAPLTSIPTVMPAIMSPQIALAGQPGMAAPSQALAAVAPAEASKPDYNVVDSPMVGTFYRAPSPDSEHFVEVGDVVNDDSTLCIIEAMKVMNEIKAEQSGEIVEILVANGEAVEYNQPLFHIRPASD
jgi:acetyl-CoA carboxylase biotin carboxyl carrier protein